MLWRVGTWFIDQTLLMIHAVISISDMKVIYVDCIKFILGPGTSYVIAVFV